VLVTTGTNAAFTVCNKTRRVTDRYVIIKNDATGYYFTLDLQTALYPEIVAARSLSLIFSDFVGTGTDLCAWARPTSSGNGFMVKADATTVTAPTALNTDGSMSGGGSRVVIQVVKGVFLAMEQTAGQVKVIAFNAAYTTATITTLVTDALRVNSVNNPCVVKNGQRYYVYYPGVNFSFEVNGSNVVTGFRWEDTRLKFTPPCFTGYASGTLFDITETWHYVVSFGNATGSSGIFTGPLNEFLKLPSSLVGYAMADAAAGALCLTSLEPKVQAAPAISYDLHKPFFNGYVMQWTEPSDPLFEILGGSIQGTNFSQYTAEYINRKTGIDQSVGGNAVFMLPPSQGVIYGTDSNSFNFNVASPFGKENQNGSSTGGAALIFKSEFPLYFYANKASSSVVKIFK
jgi:hypothetical protein